MKTSEVFNDLTKIVGKKNILTNDEDLTKYNNDWRGFYMNKSLCVLFPESVNIIKKIVKYCYIKSIKIVPQGGNTSLTGASVPT